jgi:hypothetical protein
VLPLHPLLRAAGIGQASIPQPGLGQAAAAPAAPATNWIPWTIAGALAVSIAWFAYEVSVARKAEDEAAKPKHIIVPSRDYRQMRRRMDEVTRSRMFTQL